MNDQTFKTFGDVISGLFESMFTPLIAIAVSLTAIWAVFLGLKWWRSGGDEGKRKEAKSAVISFVIGILVIFIVVVGAPLLISALVEWRANNSSLSVISDYISLVSLNVA